MPSWRICTTLRNMAETRRGYDGLGIVFVVATLLGWSSVLLFLEYLTVYIDAWTANGWRYGLSALMWLPLLVVGVRRGRLPAGIWRRAIPPAVVNCIGQACFALTVYYIDPGLAGFLMRISLVFATGGALVLFADERVLIRSGLFWLGMALVVFGSTGTVVLGYAPIAGATAVGIALGLTAGAFFGLYGVAVRHWMRGISAMTSFAAISLYTAIGMVALMVLKGESHGLGVLDLSFLGWLILVVSAFVGIALGHVFYYASIARLGVAVASAIIQLAPFLGGIASVLIFHEILTTGQWISGIVLLGGAMLLLRAEQARTKDGLVEQEGMVVEPAGERRHSESARAAALVKEVAED